MTRRKLDERWTILPTTARATQAARLSICHVLAQPITYHHGTIARAADNVKDTASIVLSNADDLISVMRRC